VAIAIFGVFYFASVLLNRQINTVTQREFDVTFEREKTRYLHEVLDFQILYRNTLMAIQGLFDASEEVTRKEWITFSENIGLASNPAIYAAAYIEKVPKSGLKEFISSVREDRSVSPNGYPNFKIFPETDKDFYYPIKYVIPMREDVRAAMGFDTAEGKVSAGAMFESADKDSITSTKNFLVDFVKKEGILMFKPIYSPNVPRGTLEERRAALEGFIVVVFSGKELLGSLFPAAPGSFVGIDVFDAAEPDILVYSTDAAEGKPLGYKPKFSEDIQLVIASRPWLLRFYSTPSFENYMSVGLGARLVRYSGPLVSLLLAIGAYLLLESRARARRLADRMTADLRREEKILKQSNYFLEESQRIGKIGSYVFEVGENQWMLSPVLAEMLGFPGEKIKSTEELTQIVHPDDRKSVSDYFQNYVLAGKHNFDKEYRVIRKNDGVERWIIGKGVLSFDEKGAPVRMVGTLQDITERKRLEEELLKSSEDRYRALFLASRDAIMTLEPPSWRFTSGNPETLRIFGLNSEGEFLTYEPWRLSPKFQADGRPSTEKALEMINKAMREGRNLFEWTHKRANGEEFPAEVLLSRVDYGNKSFLNAVVRDVTERKKAEEAIKALAEERFRIVFDSARDGMALAEAETRRFVNCNAALSAMLGYTLEELKNLGIEDIHPKEILPDILEKRARQMRGEFGVAADVPIKRKDGTVFYADISSSAIKIGDKDYVFEIFRDVTERRIAETELRAAISELRRFKLAVDNASDHIIITDADAKILYANRGAERTTGYPMKEMLGKTPALWGKQMPKRFYENMWNVIKVEKKSFTGEVVNKRKNGELYTAEFSISPILSDAGEIIYFVGVERDITKAKEIDRSKSEFVSLASHQLRTPLSAINWYAEMLLAGDAGALSDKQKDYTSEIYASSRRMAELVGALLNVSRIELGTFAIEPKPTDIRAISDSVLKELEPKIHSKNQAVIRSYSEEVPKELNLDPNLTRMILQNLLTNSVKYTPDGGRISVSLSRSDGYITMIVTDNGYGIPLEQQERVFQKFFRGDNIIPIETDGTGLGLYMVKEVVEKSGGSIHFESEENVGTTFRVSIPIAGMKRKEGTKTLEAKI
jgi:PAS domain S-box-containing protein